MAARLIWPLIALALGVAGVLGYDAYVAPARYAYSTDSASYIEMAESMRAARWPAVVPWGPELPDTEALAQPLFPPGFPLLAAATAPVFGGERAAVAALPRIAAALLPLVLLLAFRGLARDGTLVAIGVAVLCTPGVLYWHYVGYTDLPGLLCAVIALGLTARALAAIAAGRRAGAYALAAGTACALAYAVRNAGLAVIGASLAALAWEAVRRRPARAALLAWLAGLLPVVAALKLYNVVAFGQWSPYSMPASTRALAANLADWVGAQLVDVGLRAVDAPALPTGAAVVVLATAVLLGAGALWFVRPEPRSTAIVRLLFGYAALGGALVVVSRTRYEWGGTIDTRHALQYTFALLVGAALVAAKAAPRDPRAVTGGAWVLAGLLALSAVDTAIAERAEPEELARLRGDPAIGSAIAALPPEAFVASNEAAWLRLEYARRARQVDVVGDEAGFVAELSALSARVHGRPFVFVLVCEPWTARLASCAPAPPADSGCVPLREQMPSVRLCRGAPRVAG